MSTSKHPKGGRDEKGLGSDMPRPPSDFERDPGIELFEGSVRPGHRPRRFAGREHQ